MNDIPAGAVVEANREKKNREKKTRLVEGEQREEEEKKKDVPANTAAVIKLHRDIPCTGKCMLSFNKSPSSASSSRQRANECSKPLEFL